MLNSFCDSHCHPSDKQFESDLSDVIQESKDKGLKIVIGNACGCTVCFNCYHIDQDGIHLLEICESIPLIRPCIGIHPWYISTESLEKITTLINESQGKIVGIGEIGLDYAKHLIENERVNHHVYEVKHID